MYKYLKYVFATLMMVIFLFVGLQIGKTTVYAIGDPDPEWGYVCTEQSGECSKVMEDRDCTWGPSGCNDDPEEPEDNTP